MERLILLPMLSEEKCNTSVVDDSPTLLCRQTGCCAQPGISWLLSVLFSCLDGFFLICCNMKVTFIGWITPRSLDIRRTDCSQWLFLE